MSETVGARLARILAEGGVGAVFGVPGGQTLPFYAAVEDAGLQHVLMRDERAAACAAD
ncbi:MAG: thiamine pyrophosphate-binding protein, partial [Chloroflexi bacterium]|nr:thiamine pyrophosphate-binding protein [Chloroflexota bacterium]